MSDKPAFVIILTDGRAENVGATYADWHSILGYVHRSVQSAGGSTPIADQLLVNGKVVATNLHQTAWEYGTRRQKTIDDAVAEFLKQYPQPWEDKTK